MQKRTLYWLIGLFIAISLVSAGRSPAAPLYQGKTLTIVVSHAPGGGNDRLARILAKHLPKHIPGSPVVIVQNMPGASSMIAANYLYSIAKPDGLTIGSIDRGLPIAQLLHAEGVRFDLRKFAWIGSASDESTILCLRSDLPYRNFNDLLAVKESIVLGSVGPANTAHQFVLLLSQFAGLKARQIIYPSSSDVVLAVERKEVDGCAFIYNSMKPHIQRGLLRPVVRSRVAQAGIETLPVNEDLTTQKLGKTLMGIIAVGDQVGRPYLAPPGTPPQFMRILRDAFAKLAKDPELRKDAERAMMDVQYLPADDTLKIVSAMLGQPQEIINELSKYVKF